MSDNSNNASYFKRWFAKRAPRQDNTQLNLRNVYIFFSKEGALFAILLLITFIAGINYANNLVLGLCFYLASVWVISFHLTFAHVMGLKIELVDATLAQAGDPVWVTLKIMSTSSKPRRQLSFRFDYSDMPNAKEKLLALQQQNNDVNRLLSHNDSASDEHMYDHMYDNAKVLVASLSGEQFIKLPVFTHQRGEVVLPRLIISSVYPLGIMRAWSYVYFKTSAWAYPAPLAFDWQAKYMVSQDDVVVQSQHHHKGQNDFDHLDDYQEGQSLARVSWAHVARGQGMLTKNFADPVGRELQLSYADMPAMGHEEKLAQLSYALHTMADSGATFQLSLPDGVSDIGQGQAFIQACLLRLAKAGSSNAGLLKVGSSQAKSATAKRAKVR